MRLVALALLVPLALAGCSGDSGEGDVARDDTAASTPAPPAQVPAADGEVQTRDLVTVIDAGDGAQVCLGPVAESYPPQCQGTPLAGWRWERPATGGAGERVGDVRFGQFALSGTWDGETLTVSDSIPAALYTPVVEEEPPPAEPLRQYADERLREIAEEVSAVDVAVGAYVQAKQVVLDVPYDDGSIQAWADEAYGANVVLVVPVLEPVDG